MFIARSDSEIPHVLNEISKVDPSFDLQEFLRFCETDIIPNVLEVSVPVDTRYIVAITDRIVLCL